MTVKSRTRGHEIYYDTDDLIWRFVDTNELDDNTIACKKCGCKPTLERYDACTGRINGARGACCGHGVYDKFVLYD